MALSAAMVWEVRTTGNAANGGAFKAGASGQDYSQQASPQVTYDGTVLAFERVTNSSIQSSGSTARPFTADDVGNVLNITGGAGFTTGRYEIASVASGVATLDRACNAGSGSGGTGRLGGALATLAGALSAMAAGNTIYITGTSYTITAEMATTLAGAAGDPNEIIGYGTSRTDGTKAKITVSSALGGSDAALDIDAAHWVVRNLWIEANGNADWCFELNGGPTLLDNCKASGWDLRGFLCESLSGCVVQDCEAVSGIGGSTSTTFTRGGFCATGGDVWFKRCLARACDSNGFSIDTTNGSVISHCIVTDMNQESATNGNGIQIITGYAYITNCTFHDIEGDGIRFESTATPQNASIDNCLFSEVVGFALNNEGTSLASSHQGLRFRRNAFYNVSDESQNLTLGTTDVISLTASPFVDATLDFDLNLNTEEGGGALVRQAGLPGDYPGLSEAAAYDVIGYETIGALEPSLLSSSGDAGDGMRSLWREWTNERSTTVIPDTTVDLYIQSGMEALNRRVKFATTTDNTSITLVSGTQEYTLPDDVIEILWVEVDNGSFKQELKKSDIEEWRRRGIQWRTAPAGTPTEWAFYGDQLVLYPKPDARAASELTLVFRYVRTPRNFTAYGPEHLATQDYRIPVTYGVWQYGQTPTSQMTPDRAEGFKRMFDEETTGVVDYYRMRGVMR